MKRKETNAVPVNGTEPKLIDKRRASEILGMSTRSVDRIVCRGKLDKVKMLGAVRFRLSDVLKLVREGVL